jgi:hypothetical protein
MEEPLHSATTGTRGAFSGVRVHYCSGDRWQVVAATGGAAPPRRPGSSTAGSLSGRGLLAALRSPVAAPTVSPSPGADVGRGGEPSPGADGGGVSPVPVQMWAG